jgi:hypothetical protein
MALNIKIDFNERYSTYLSPDIKYSAFDTELVNGKKLRLDIKISTNEHHLMPDVYNLAFGPFDENHEIDDKVKLKHKSHSKVFSTIVFEALSFLSEHPDKFLGIDGSNTARTYMYYRCIQNNYDYLATHFLIYGVNYYARILRDGTPDFDLDSLLIVPNPIHKGEIISCEKLYNYFIFKAK